MTDRPDRADRTASSDDGDDRDDASSETRPDDGFGPIRKPEKFSRSSRSSDSSELRDSSNSSDPSDTRNSSTPGESDESGDPNSRGVESEQSTDDAFSPAGRDEPLSDLASAVSERTSRSGSDGSDDAFDDLFEREDVAEIDSDQLWERLENDRPPADLLEEEREIREIEKHSYCHRCEHFSEPPSVECTREGTEILELNSLETFRVADCPVVLEDEELERRY